MSELKPTTEESIRHFEAQQKRYVREHNGKPCPHYANAIDALRRVQPANEPLTLEQLRQMDGDKINIHYIGHCKGFWEDVIAPYYGKYEQYVCEYNGMIRATDLPLQYFGTEWTATAYTHKPGGEQE